MEEKQSNLGCIILTVILIIGMAIIAPYVPTLIQILFWSGPA
jgi:hypothetical protein